MLTWYLLARRSLPCASSAGSDWKPALTDRGIANRTHVQWYIKPTSDQATDTFVVCLADQGFKIYRGEGKGTSAVRGEDTISTGDGAGFPNPDDRFERW
jgi:hypothetical protein